MANTELKKTWFTHYRSAPEQLKKMSEVRGLISAFNANIDAVIKISGKKILELIDKNKMDHAALMASGERIIRNKEDLLRGLLKCFCKGIAEEWIIEQKAVFDWLNAELGYDALQMGGQGGIVANAMAVCGVQNVYVHTASAPQQQSGLFLDLPNLKNVDDTGTLRQASRINRPNDIPLIHWIMEFDKDDELKLGGVSYRCPKSNRFIATYDPLNLKLAIDLQFAQAMHTAQMPIDFIILSGYQMLSRVLPDGSPGIDRIEASIETVEAWRKQNPGSLLHLELASTQDQTIRKYLVDKLARRADSTGFNERELIDILEVIGEDALAKSCNDETNSSNLFKAMLRVFDYMACPRMQLHMFGLYVTLQKKHFRLSPLQNRKGMQLAAVVAATKAGTGHINSAEGLLWSGDHQVSDTGLAELKSLSETVAQIFGPNTLLKDGMYTNDKLEIIAVPTILIEKPITLVGMGDTISSISLVGAR